MISFNRKFIVSSNFFFKSLIPSISYNCARWMQQLNQSSVFHDLMGFNSQDTRVMSCMGYLVYTILVNSAKLKEAEIKEIVNFLKKKRHLKVKRTILKLNITFMKKNIFFNLAKSNGDSIYMTTTRRQGYSGRRMVEYASIYSTARVVKNVLKKYKRNKVAVFYNGWHRFRFAIVKALEASDGHRLKIKYLRYIIKIPHNGCRLIKKRGRHFVSKWYRGTRKFK